MMQMQNLEIVQAEVDDIPRLHEIALQMKASKRDDYFDKALELQGQGERLIMIARYGGQDAGYCMLSWAPKYGFYRAHGCPEIQDLNVLPSFRQKGIASAMIAYCEGLAAQKNIQYMGISVGLAASYGAAQRLYVKLGYVPDGYGVTYDRQTVSFGEIRPVDDELCLMMLKDLQKA